MARMQGVSSRAGGVSWVFHRALSHPTTSWFQSRTRARASKRVYRTVFLIPYLRRNQMAWGWAWRFANQSSKGTAAAFGRCLDPPMVPSFNSLCRPWMAVPENGHDLALASHLHGRWIGSTVRHCDTSQPCPLCPYILVQAITGARPRFI